MSTRYTKRTGYLAFAFAIMAIAMDVVLLQNTEAIRAMLVGQ